MRFLLLFSLLASVARAATVNIPLQPGETAAVTCAGDALIIDGSTATTASLSCTQSSPFVGIDPTGATDVTGLLNAVLAALPNGTTATFPPNGLYRIEGTLMVLNKSGITLDGNGSTFYATTDGTGTASQIRVRSQWRIQMSSNITMRNMVIRGSGTATGPTGTYDPKREAQHGIDIQGGFGVLIEHVDIGSVWGDTIDVAASPAGTGQLPSTDVTIQDSQLADTSRMGLAIVDGERVTVQRNVIARSRRTLIDLEPNAPINGLVFVNILDNQLALTGQGFPVISNAGAAGDVHDLVIDGNQWTGNPKSFRIWILAPSSARRRNITITNNVGHTAGAQNEPMVTLANVDQATVSGNTASFALGTWPTRGPRVGQLRAPVVAFCSTDVVLLGNTFTRPTGMPELAQGCS